MFKFVNAGEDGSTPKRQQSQRACSPCRARKKRCLHQSPSFSDGVDAQKPTSTNKQPNRTSVSIDISNSQVQPPSQFLSHINHTGISNGRTSTLSSYHRPPNEESMGARFIGDLNPESVFLAASPDENRGVSTNSVGVWLKTSDKTAPQPGTTILADPPPSSLFSSSAYATQTGVVPLLKQECLATLPPQSQLAALCKIYFDKMHPMFPVIDFDEFHKVRKRDNCQVLLQQAVCLAASKNFAAKPHLLIGEVDVVLSSMEFGDKISGAMRLAIEMGMVTDKVVLIQALALMSQFFDSVDRGDLSSQFCARAVHNAHSIGLQVKIREGEEREHYGITLLCCIWSIDRMNAAFNGRPVLMHERDVRKDMNECFEQQPPTFRLFLKVIELLDKIIDLYRVTSSLDQVAMEFSYPSFEVLVLGCDGESISTWSLATIETLYHAVTILSCRSKSLTEVQRLSASYLRQTLSTSILTSNITQELRDLVLFPFVPYAISLALSISYREMRHGKISLHRARARIQFQVLSDALSELKGSFRSAANTAVMGKKLLKEMDRVVSTVSGTKTPLQPARSNGVQGHSTVSNPSATIPSATHSEADPVTINILGQFEPLPEFDPSIFDLGDDVDLFGMFDPAFNLDGFDAFLDSNLDPSFPTYF